MSSFVIKIIAAVSMLIDHMGLLLFPQYGIMRILGRLAFPLYAFCIAEGFYYTRDRKRYFLQIFVLGLLCQIVYFIADGSMYLGVLIAFSMSILLMWALDEVKKALAAKDGTMKAAAIFVLSLAAVAALCHFMTVDYGFVGILLPVLAFASDKKWVRLGLFSLGLAALCAVIQVSGGLDVQWWAMAALPLLALYNGKPGKYRMKYFFYIFYPAHLAVLYLIAMFV
ncbi:MAG: hypothetical protein IJB09_07035 [Oscillospiraceae bacterium]|nr:hypothetical protein [Oscillospiraceae bacterium]